MTSSRSRHGVPAVSPLAKYRWMTSSVKPGVVQMEVSRCRRPAVTPASSSSSRRAHAAGSRSEEHTSELQSRLHLVCRLLLEKKKKIQESSTSRNAEQRLDKSSPH